MATKNADTVSEVSFGKVKIDSYLTSRKPSGVKGGEVIKFPDNWKIITGQKITAEEVHRKKLNWGFTEISSDLEGMDS